MSPQALSTESFEYLRTFVLQEAAIVLSPGKEYLAQSRLEPIARKEGLADIDTLVRAMRSDTSGKLKAQVVDAMTTNETLFFRDIHPFDALRDSIIPELIEKRRATKTLDIWCAAASTGQEPYSILMTIKENFPELATWRVRLLGTDISESALERAKAASYSQMEVNRGLPMKLLVKYFSRNGMEWRLNPDVRAGAEYRLFNLASTWPQIGPFDLVFMRNVLIYFSPETKEAIVNKAARVLKNDGYFILGSTESLLSTKSPFKRVQHGKSTCYSLSA